MNVICLAIRGSSRPLKSLYALFRSTLPAVAVAEEAVVVFFVLVVTATLLTVGIGGFRVVFDFGLSVLVDEPLITSLLLALAAVVSVVGLVEVLFCIAVLFVTAALTDFFTTVLFDEVLLCAEA